MTEKTFPTLYTLDSRKKVRVFECEVKQVKPEVSDVLDATFAVYTRTGLLGGKLIERLEPITTGVNKGKKNETSVLQQAINQAESLWRDKTHEGYKSLDMMPMGESTIKDNINNTLIDYYKRHPEAAYTNENWDMLPQLAIKWKDVKKPTYPYYAQPKYNGVRCLAKIKSYDRDQTSISYQIKLCSRGGTYYKVPNIEMQLIKLYDYLLNTGMTLSHYILDGELYKHNTPLQEISGAARKEDTDLFSSNDWLEFHIYDVIDTSGPKIQRERLTDMLAITLRLDQATEKFPNIKFVKTKMVYDKQEVDDLHAEYLEQGYEGLILRDPNYVYEFNTRSKGLIKVKNFIDEEFEIVGAEIDENKPVGESFVFVLRNNTNDKTFKARPTGTIQLKEKWFQQIESYLGKQATVRYQERSKDGLPVQAHVRSDLTEVLHIRPKDE